MTIKADAEWATGPIMTPVDGQFMPVDGSEVQARSEIDVLGFEAKGEIRFIFDCGIVGGGSYPFAITLPQLSNWFCLNYGVDLLEDRLAIEAFAKALEAEAARVRAWGLADREIQYPRQPAR